MFQAVKGKRSPKCFTAGSTFLDFPPCLNREITLNKALNFVNVKRNITYFLANTLVRSQFTALFELSKVTEL